jgi:hypothetical protein
MYTLVSLHEQVVDLRVCVGSVVAVVLVESSDTVHEFDSEWIPL